MRKKRTTRSPSKKIVKKSRIRSDLVKRLVKPTSGAANKMSQEEQTQRDLAMMNDTSYPIGILYQTLREIYGVPMDNKRLQLFVSTLLQRLSLLSTRGQDASIYSTDFDDFFRLIVQSMNLLGGMKQALQDNGIEFDIKKYIDGLYGNDDEEK